jgi:hypothetical protein
MASKEKTKALAYVRTSSAANAGTDKDSDKRQRAAIAAPCDLPHRHHTGPCRHAQPIAPQLRQEPVRLLGELSSVNSLTIVALPPHDQRRESRHTGCKADLAEAHGCNRVYEVHHPASSTRPALGLGPQAFRSSGPPV